MYNLEILLGKRRYETLLGKTLEFYYVPVVTVRPSIATKEDFNQFFEATIRKIIIGGYSTDTGGKSGLKTEAMHIDLMSSLAAVSSHDKQAIYEYEHGCLLTEGQSRSDRRSNTTKLISWDVDGRVRIGETTTDVVSAKLSFRCVNQNYANLLTNTLGEIGKLKHIARQQGMIYQSLIFANFCNSNNIKVKDGKIIIEPVSESYEIDTRHDVDPNALLKIVIANTTYDFVADLKEGDSENRLIEIVKAGDFKIANVNASVLYEAFKSCGSREY